MAYSECTLFQWLHIEQLKSIHIHYTWKANHWLFWIGNIANAAFQRVLTSTIEDKSLTNNHYLKHIELSLLLFFWFVGWLFTFYHGELPLNYPLDAVCRKSWTKSKSHIFSKRDWMPYFPIKTKAGKTEIYSIPTTNKEAGSFFAVWEFRVTFFCEDFFNLETSNKHISLAACCSRIQRYFDHKPQKKGSKDDTFLRCFFGVFLSTTFLFLILRFALQTVRLVSLALSCLGFLWESRDGGAAEKFYQERSTWGLKMVEVVLYANSSQFNP